jgi:hypothetical protein
MTIVTDDGRGPETTDRASGVPLARAGSRADRQAAGAFYTPIAVCRYIVTRTLDAALADQREPAAHEARDDGSANGSNGSAAPLRILDPACGDGAFLLACCDRFMTPGAGNAPRPIELVGIDTDVAAVESARSLLDGVLCPQDPLLPAISHTVLAGDALLDDRLEDASFDIILGNPPYRRERDYKAELDAIAATPFGQRYREPRMDLWYYFLHRGIELLRPGGRLSFIVSSYWTKGSGSRRLIQSLASDVQVEEIFDLSDLPIFAGVQGRHMILTIRKTPPTDEIVVKATGVGGTAARYLDGRAPAVVIRKPSSEVFRHGRVDLLPDDPLLEKIARHPPLHTLAEIRQGIAENPAIINRRTNERFDNRWREGEGVFALTIEELNALSPSYDELKLMRPYHMGADITRLAVAKAPSRWLIYTTAETCPDIELFPALHAHLERFRPVMEARRETQRGKRAWWQLHWPRDPQVWIQPKVIVPQLAERPIFAPAPDPTYVPFSMNVCIPGPDAGEDLMYLAAVLSSRVLWKWFEHTAKRRGAGVELTGSTLRSAPIRRIDFANPTDARRHADVVDAGRQVAEYRARLARAEGTGAETRRIRGAIDAAEQRLEWLVCELYAITRDEEARLPHVSEID